MNEKNRAITHQPALEPAESLSAVEKTALSKAFHKFAIRTVISSVLQKEIEKKDWHSTIQLANEASKAGMQVDLTPYAPKITQAFHESAEEQDWWQYFTIAKDAAFLGISPDLSLIQSKLDESIQNKNWFQVGTLLRNATPFLPETTVTAYQPNIQHGLDEMMQKNINFETYIDIAVYLFHMHEANIPLDVSPYRDCLQQKTVEFLENKTEKINPNSLFNLIKYLIQSTAITQVDDILARVKDQYGYTQAYPNFLTAATEAGIATNPLQYTKDLTDLLALQQPYPYIFFMTFEKAAALKLINPQQYKDIIDQYLQTSIRDDHPIVFSSYLENVYKAGVFPDMSIFSNAGEQKLFEFLQGEDIHGAIASYLLRMIQIGALDFSSPLHEDIETFFASHTAIPQEYMVFAALYGADLARKGEPLEQIENKGIRTLESLIAYSEEKNKLLEPDKQTKDVKNFWQRNQTRLAKMLGIHETFAQEYIKMTISQFGFPRLEVALGLLDRLDDSVRDTITELMKKTTHADQAFLGKLLELADAYERFDNLNEFTAIASRAATTSKQEVLHTLAPELLNLLAKKLSLPERVDSQALEQWDINNLSKLLVAQKQFTPQAMALFELIFSSTVHNDFQKILHDQAVDTTRYTNEQKALITSIQEHNRHVADEFAQEGIDHNVWMNDKTKSSFAATETYEQNTENELRKFREKLFKQFSLLLETTQDPEKGDIPPLLSPDRIKRFKQSVLKKLQYEMKNGVFYRNGKEFEGLPEDVANQAIVFLRDEIAVLKKQCAAAEQTKPTEQMKGISISLEGAQLQYLPADPQQTMLTNLQRVQSELKDLVRHRIPLLAKSLKQRSFSLDVKVWDRQPGKDLFQGNHTQCCVAVDSDKKFKIGDYLTNTAMTVLEVVDQNTQLPIAQTYVYFIKNREGETAMVLDNIEINKNYLGIQKAIGNNLVAYAKEFAERLTKDSGKPISKILLGKRQNGDVVTKQIPMTTEYITNVVGGNGVFGSTYLDALGPGWVDFCAPAKEAFFVLQGKTPKRRSPFEQLYAPTVVTSGTITPDMLAQISEIERASFIQDLRDSDTVIEETLQNENTAFSLLMDGQKVLGYLFAEPTEEKDAWYVSSFAIHPWYRHPSHSRQLMQSIYDLAKQKQIKKISMHVRAGEKLSTILQKKYGAQYVKTEYNWENTGIPYELLEITTP